MAKINMDNDTVVWQKHELRRLFEVQTWLCKVARYLPDDNIYVEGAKAVTAVNVKLNNMQGPDNDGGTKAADDGSTKRSRRGAPSDTVAEVAE